jgi:hypothetical protein
VIEWTAEMILTPESLRYSGVNCCRWSWVNTCKNMHAWPLNSARFWGLPSCWVGYEHTTKIQQPCMHILILYGMSDQGETGSTGWILRRQDGQRNNSCSYLMVVPLSNCHCTSGDRYIYLPTYTSDQQECKILLN